MERGKGERWGREARRLPKKRNQEGKAESKGSLREEPGQGPQQTDKGPQTSRQEEVVGREVK